MHHGVPGLEAVLLGELAARVDRVVEARHLLLDVEDRAVEVAHAVLQYAVPRRVKLGSLVRENQYLW